MVPSTVVASIVVNLQLNTKYLTWSIKTANTFLYVIDYTFCQRTKLTQKLARLALS